MLIQTYIHASGALFHGVLHWCWKCFAAAACVLFCVWFFVFPLLEHSLVLSMDIFSVFVSVCFFHSLSLCFASFWCDFVAVLFSFSDFWLCVDWWRHYRLYSIILCFVPFEAAINHTYTHNFHYEKKISLAIQWPEMSFSNFFFSLFSLSLVSFFFARIFPSVQPIHHRVCMFHILYPCMYRTFSYSRSKHKYTNNSNAFRSCECVFIEYAICTILFEWP